MPSLPVGDVTLYYETAGQGAPLLLLHGLGSSTQDWALQLPVFAEAYRVVAVDMRGHGRSAHPSGPYSVPQFAADVAELLTALDAAPAHVLGISMGGMVALQLALDRPELVRSLIVVNSYVSLRLETIGQRLEWLRRIFLIRALGMRRVGRFLAGRLFPEPGQAALRQTMIARWAANDRRAYLATIRGLRGWDVRPRLAEIRQPVLVVGGDQDYTPVAEKAAYTARMPHARLEIIANSRHATPVDQPARFNVLALGFLAAAAGSG